MKKRNLAQDKIARKARFFAKELLSHIDELTEDERKEFMPNWSRYFRSHLEDLFTDIYENNRS